MLNGDGKEIGNVNKIMKNVETEVLCTLQVYSQEEGTDSCLVYLDLEARGLSFTFLKVESFKDEIDHEILTPEISYTSLPESYFKADYFFDKTATPNGFVMSHDTVISIISGQSLRLRKIHNFLDPLVLTYHDGVSQRRTFEFSLSSVNDVTSGKQKSGHYSMTVD